MIIGKYKRRRKEKVVQHDLVIISNVYILQRKTSFNVKY